MVVPVREVKIAGSVDGHAGRLVQLCSRSQPAIARKTRSAIARHRGNDPIRRNLADAVVGGIHDVEVA
jgi:hypothetical protein